MNRIFNLIWSRTKECWIVVSEKVKGNGKVPSSPLKSIALLAAMFAAGGPAYALDPGALPTGGQVTSGSASVVTSGNQMTVNQSTQKMVANWQGFDIGSAAGVRFNQPNNSSTALNRVVGNNPSQIFGSLTSNGKVFLVNPSGVLFAPGASVNVGALVASSLNIKDSDFLAEKYSFYKDGSGASVVNQGNISGGFVALLGNTVDNSGTIVTSKGTTGLGAGEAITLGFDPSGLMAITVDKAAYQAQVTNSGVIEADGGTVVMTASAADALLATVVNNSGTVRATGMVERNGEIVIEAGTVNNSGTLDVSGVKGGAITLIGDHITLASGSTLEATGATGGGKIVLEASGSGSGAIFQNGTVMAGERIDATASLLFNTGTLQAGNANGGGQIRLTAAEYMDSGTVDASSTGAAGNGGAITITASLSAEQASVGQIRADGRNGGSITLTAGGSAYLSGLSSASASDGHGGSIAITAPSLSLASARLHADGAETGDGGSIKAGGGWQGGDATLANANTTYIDANTQVTVNAGKVGAGGTAVLWSDQRTDFAGSIQARGGSVSGDGGQVEVSSHDTLAFAGTVNAGATNGANGQLLLDPKNINIETTVSTSSFTKTNLPDSNTDNYAWGQKIIELSNGNIVVTGYGPDISTGAFRGVVRLFNGSTGALIATFTGNGSNDKIGNGGPLIGLSNGNVIMTSPYYGAVDNQNYVCVGAITWFNGTTGALNTGTVGGGIDQSNSLIGANYGNNYAGFYYTTYGDHLGSGGVLQLANGNALVGSPSYGTLNGGTSDQGKGAFTWVNGSTGKFKDAVYGAATGGYVNGGTISSYNSLIGATDYAQWGSNLDSNLPSYTQILSSGNVLYKGRKGVVWIKADGSTAQGSLASGSAHVFLGSDSGSFKTTVLSDGNFVLGSSTGNSSQGYSVWVNGSTGVTRGGVDHLNYNDTLTSANALIGDSTYTGGGRRCVGARRWALRGAGHQIGHLGGCQRRRRHGYQRGGYGERHQQLHRLCLPTHRLQAEQRQLRAGRTVRHL